MYFYQTIRRKITLNFFNRLRLICFQYSSFCAALQGTFCLFRLRPLTCCGQLILPFSLAGVFGMASDGITPPSSLSKCLQDAPFSLCRGPFCKRKRGAADAAPRFALFFGCRRKPVCYAPVFRVTSTALATPSTTSLSYVMVTLSPTLSTGSDVSCSTDMAKYSG